MSKELIITQKHIENKIYNVRGLQVMLDSDLADIYGVTTGRLNEQVKRNIERFPFDFMFQLTQEEWNSLMLQNETPSLTSQNAILENNQGKHRKYLPYVFTEQGVSGLSGVLKSPTASKMHVAIMRAFVEMRKLIANHSGLLQRMDGIELQTFTKSHDRFLIIDHEEVFHLGASLKDLGKKWFAFSKMDKSSVASILSEL